MKRRALLLLLLIPFAAHGEVWTATESSDDGVTGAIADGTDASLINEFFSALKYEIRMREEVEHCFGDNTEGCFASGGGGSQTEDHGRHREGSCRIFMQDATPANLVRSDYDNTSDRVSGSGANTLDDGRLWVDSDDSNRMYVYDENGTPSFEGITVGALTVKSSDADILQGSFNLLFNGDFDAGDGDNNDAVPLGWTEVGTPSVYTYSNTDASEGEGYDLTVTSDAATEGIEWALTGLKASTQYKVVGRVKATSGDTCRVHVDAKGGTDLSNIDTTATSYTTVSGVFTTDASQDADIELINVTSGDVCFWDHFAVYEMRDETATRYEIPNPGILAYYQEDDTADSDITTTTTIISIPVSVPGPGYMVEFTGNAHFSCANTGGDIVLDLYNGSSVIKEVYMECQTGNDDAVNVVITHADLTPTIGATTYSMRATAATTNGDLTNSAGATGSTLTAAHSLLIKVIPTR